MPGRDPDTAAALLAESLGAARPRLLGLVPATRGADTLTLCGWTGPLNHTNETEEISAVVRSWEERFGARVVTVGYSTLELSVAAPPTTLEHARQVAAEHEAFAPDTIWQGCGDFEDYAEALVGSGDWSFTSRPVTLKLQRQAMAEQVNGPVRNREARATEPCLA
ncbi:DUF4253 domain-containing protein [Nonomuraea sp. NPDC049028]|uniref:DUF4253 domain-containing protein n=1 Tax=Nonomuraea sp. NPDC049028 TaxID=3364348 RepID=UPI00371C5778